VSWFKIDDGFHCHAKVMAAGTPAVGLYVRCGSWAAQQTSDGFIPKQVARMYGTPRMIKALIEVGLWHQKGHDCAACPEVDGNSYLIHEYLERNPSRVAVELERKAKSKRQQKWRENKRNAQANQGDGRDVDGDVDASTRHHGDGSPDPTRPVPSLLPTEEELARGARDADPVDNEIPDVLQPLADALHHAGLRGIRWSLRGDEGFRIHNLMTRKGIDAMAAAAHTATGRAREPVAHVRYFLHAWQELPNLPAAPPAGSGVPMLRAVGAEPPVSTTDQRVRQALEAGERLQRLLDEREQA
jgi:hypothetical protein